MAEDPFPGDPQHKANEALDKAARDSSPEARNRDFLWKEYDHLGELYRFYLELIVKAALAYTIIVGTISTLVLANTRSEPAVDWGLLPLSLLSGALAVGAFWSLSLISELENRVTSLADQLDIGLAMHIRILRITTQVLGILFGVTSALLVGRLIALRLT